MATPAELAQQHTDLAPEELGHLQRLLGSWSLLADLSFSDLLLLVPASTSHPLHRGGRPEMVVLGQMRPNNRPTLILEDLVGQTVPEDEWTLSAEALHHGEIVRSKVHHPIMGEPVPVENIPVRFGDNVIAVMLRVYVTPASGPTSQYERRYLKVFQRFADMVAQSAFPFPDEDVAIEEAPRIGDGVVIVDAEGRVEYASPNAINAFHRMGVYTEPHGACFSDLGVEESAVEAALASLRPVVEEVERRPDVVVLVHCIPLLSHAKITGGIILIRDVTDVRRLDRLLLSKDAAIREVHHRVKNNLQTISSLLSLQARRVDGGAAREALHEAERRVRSIALVHEILSRDPGDQVPFDEIVASLVQMAEDSVVSTRPVEITVEGDLGDIGADVATPLAVTLAELLQNAVEHAFDADTFASSGAAVGLEGAGGAAGYVPVGHVHVTLALVGLELHVTVRDDGCGLPEDFAIERTTSLGLSIVRNLVASQLGGTISMFGLPVAAGGGTQVDIVVPQIPRRLTRSIGGATVAGRFDLVIFDCDGVLVDSERLAVRTEVAILAELGWPLSEAQVIERFVGRSAQYMHGEIERALGRSIDWDRQFEDRYRQVFERELRPVDGVADAIAAIDLPRCVASSGTHDKIRSSLALTGLLDAFEGRIFSVQDVERGKPAPDLFLHAARAMGADPRRCAVVEDSRSGVDAARAAQMAVFAYAAGVTPAERLAGDGVVVFDDMSALAGLLTD